MKKSKVSKVIKKFRKAGPVKTEHNGRRSPKTTPRQDNIITRE